METDQKDNCNFVIAGHVHENGTGHSHDGTSHSHDHGHTHEIMDSPGKYVDRDKPVYRTDWKQRAYTIGIGGPVGSGKTALVLGLCKHLRDSHNICVVTNDIFTREDWEFLVRNKALPEERMRSVETGGCPHAAIREDFSLNMEEVKELTEQFHPEVVIIESGGDNLAANFSRELADFIIYVVDVAGGDKVPRKGGPGITQSDLLVINKTDLAEAVGADLKPRHDKTNKVACATNEDPDKPGHLPSVIRVIAVGREVMERDANLMRQNGPTIFTQAKHMKGIPEIADMILQSHKEATLCS